MREDSSARCVCGKRTVVVLCRVNHRNMDGYGGLIFRGGCDSCGRPIELRVEAHRSKKKPKSETIVRAEAKP